MDLSRCVPSSSRGVSPILWSHAFTAGDLYFLMPDSFNKQCDKWSLFRLPQKHLIEFRSKSSSNCIMGAAISSQEGWQLSLDLRSRLTLLWFLSSLSDQLGICARSYFRSLVRINYLHRWFWLVLLKPLSNIASYFAAPGYISRSSYGKYFIQRHRLWIYLLPWGTFSGFRIQMQTRCCFPAHMPTTGCYWLTLTGRFQRRPPRFSRCPRIFNLISVIIVIITRSFWAPQIFGKKTYPWTYLWPKNHYRQSPTSSVLISVDPVSSERFWQCDPSPKFRLWRASLLVDFKATS